MKAKYVSSRWDALKLGNEATTKQNLFSRERDVCVMGLGGSFDEAFENAKLKLEKRLEKGDYNIIQINNGVPLRNGANYEYCVSARLYRIKKE